MQYVNIVPITLVLVLLKAYSAASAKPQRGEGSRGRDVTRRATIGRHQSAMTSRHRTTHGSRSSHRNHPKNNTIIINYNTIIYIVVRQIPVTI